MKKHVSLSVKSLETVYDWAEKTENSSEIASEYIKLCGACGAFMDTRCYLLYKYNKKSHEIYREKWWEAYNATFRARDTLGRYILNQIKKGVFV